MTLRVTHPNISRYVDRKNAWANVFGEKDRIDLRNLTKAEKAKLLESLDCDLSPENLCCDGELHGVALVNKAAYLNAAKTELETL
jgi:hypothetical protein